MRHLKCSATSVLLNYITELNITQQYQLAISLHKTELPMKWSWLFPRVRGFSENIRQFILRLRFFFFFLRGDLLAHANFTL